MTTPTPAAAIAQALAEDDSALLETLGYRSPRTLPGQPGDPAQFLRQFPAANPDTQSEAYFLRETRSVRILFQLTGAEIAATEQQPLFDTAATTFDTGNARSFLFAAVTLRGATYPRGRYAALTRELNRRFPVPMVILFRAADRAADHAADTGGRVTLAFVRRRPNRHHPDRDVVGSVSLIREISPTSPHRAHLDILADLSLPARLRWLDAHGKPRNFDGLLAAWLAALDTEALNRRFYRDLFAWFERAIAAARFPANQPVALPPEEHIIRLITRLLFVWFLKEKGLVADDLFVEHQVAGLLQDYNRAAGDSYYRAVLQNLFFATLNTEINQRRFSRRTNSDHRNFAVYRYQDEITDPERMRALFAQTPFVNGGLFDCLDSFDATTNGGIRVDCFTDNASHRAGHSVPNHLFFGDDASPGIIDLFRRYRFTVEENTPAEQEVALDPELLGKVFENLLAAVNPETRQTARRETGSYYTPRPVVDYMVDEALVAALTPANADGDGAAAADDDAAADDAPLRYLLDYADAFADRDALFAEPQRETIIRAIARLKVIDPAVGSGAFPMGILHKLTLALRRLDPDNHIWEQVQREQASARAGDAFDIDNPADRDAELTEISATFERYRDSDYGRKLYLIQNCIYGVDVQPIAAQIAKLRFFISLAIEQQPSADAADNYGIRPLPNLETRFVAADALLPLARPAQRALGQTAAVTRLERQIADNRERHFHATTRAAKRDCRQEDAKLRAQLAAALGADGFSAAAADQLAAWDAFDQNAPAAEWFDAEYMFGVPDGFDIVIGNPPYVQLQKDGGRLGRRYQKAGFATYARTGDVYQLFYEKGCQLLAPARGILSCITSNSWLKAEYGKSTRRYLAEQHSPLRLLEMGKDVFEQAIVDASILIARQGPGDAPALGVDLDRLDDKSFPPEASLWHEFRPQGENPWSLLTPTEQSVMDKIVSAGTPLKDWDVTINRGVTTGLNAAFIIDEATRQALIAANPKSAEIIKPIVRGRDIQRWQAQSSDQYLLFVPWHFPLHLDPSVKGSSDQAEGLFQEQYPAVYNHLLAHQTALASRNKSETGIRYEWYALQRWGANYHEGFAKPKLFWADMVKDGRFAYSDTEMYCNDKGYFMTGKSLKYLCAVLNSRLITWYVQHTAPTTGMGLTEWKVFVVERIPVPRLTPARQRPLTRLVDRILEAKAANPQSDTSADEEELDRRVYALYGLTAEEVAAVGGG